MSKCENCKWFNTGRIENRCFSCIEQSAMKRVDLFEEKPKECEMDGRNWPQFSQLNPPPLLNHAAPSEPEKITLPEKVEMNTAWDLDKRMCKAINQIIDYLRERNEKTI